MKKVLFLSMLLAVSALQAQDSGPRSFTLKEAVDYAIENNNAVKNARIDEQKSKARNWEILTMGLPQVTGNVDYTYYFKTPIVPAFNRFFSDTTGASARVLSYQAKQDTNIRNILYQSALDSKNQQISFVLPNTLSAGLQLSQLIFDARYLIGVKATKDLMKTSRLSREMSEQEIRYSVAKAYYQAEAAQESMSLLGENLKVIEKLWSDTKAVFAQGLIEEMDVDRLELAKANLESQINIQNQMAEVGLANLKFQMGMPLGEVIVLKERLNELKDQAGLPVENKFDPSARIEYDLLQTAIKLNGYDVKQKQSGYAPYMTGFLNYAWTAQTETFGDIFKRDSQSYPDGSTKKVSPWYSQGLFGVSLKVPIFDSGMKHAQIKQAKLEQQKTKNDLDNFKNASLLQYSAAQSTFNAALSDEVNSKRTLDLSKKIYGKNQIKFTEGVGSSFELSQAQQEFTTNQLKYIQSIMNLLNAKADLDKSLGIK
ncbi:MAG: TolC family protein [Bacteroidetes bacterium]|nr:TolC family protein [Bacteroidota bacterium]